MSTHYKNSIEIEIKKIKQIKSKKKIDIEKINKNFETKIKNSKKRILDYKTFINQKEKSEL